MVPQYSLTIGREQRFGVDLGKIWGRYRNQSARLCMSQIINYVWLLNHVRETVPSTRRK